MHEVSKSAFYKDIHDRGLDLIPSPHLERDNDTGRCIGMYSIWKFRDGRVYGKSISPHDSRPKQYFIK